MAHVDGTAFKVYHNTGTYATPVYTAVGGEVDCTLNFSNSLKNTTDKGSSNWEEFITGVRSWDVSLNIKYDAGDSAITQIEVDALAGTKTKVEVKTLNSNKFYGDVFVQSLSLASAHDGIVTMPVTLKGTSTLTKAAA